jgi:molybdopterin-guanine dinucleotide biosynthesis protein A
MTFTALLLTGGESRRMGTDKATLNFFGEPLWEKQLRILRELEPSALMISARAKPDWFPENIELILDEPPSRGPLSGIAAALNRIRTSHLLALAIDMPRMSAAHLKLLLNLARPGIGVVPANPNFFEPLCAIYPRESADAAQHALNRGDVRLQNFARHLYEAGQITTRAILDSEKILYQNANTIQEFENAADNIRVK